MKKRTLYMGGRASKTIYSCVLQAIETNIQILVPSRKIKTELLKTYKSIGLTGSHIIVARPKKRPSMSWDFADGFKKPHGNPLQKYINRLNGKFIKEV